MNAAETWIVSLIAVAGVSWFFWWIYDLTKATEDRFIKLLEEHVGLYQSDQYCIFGTLRHGDAASFRVMTGEGEGADSWDWFDEQPVLTGTVELDATIGRVLFKTPQGNFETWELIHA